MCVLLQCVQLLVFLDCRLKARGNRDIMQLKHSSLHLEKRLVSQRILEHEVSLQVLREWMEEIERGIVHSTTAVGSMHSLMDQVGIPIPDMPEHMALAILCLEVRLSHLSDYHAT
jgi:hypothetical protein